MVVKFSASLIAAVVTLFLNNRDPSILGSFHLLEENLNNRLLRVMEKNILSALVSHISCLRTDSCSKKIDVKLRKMT
jgi:hypothetical protein